MNKISSNKFNYLLRTKSTNLDFYIGAHKNISTLCIPIFNFAKMLLQSAKTYSTVQYSTVHTSIILFVHFDLVFKGVRKTF